MNWLDLFIGLFLVTALIRGSEVGFIRQIFSTSGFFIGLFFGAWLQNLLISLARTPNSRALLALLVTLGFALAFMTIGEYFGLLVKFKLREAKITNKLDRIFGSGIAVISLLVAAWLGAAVFRNIPDSGWQRQIRTSRFVAALDSHLPSAPNLLTRLGHLIDPNNFPQVFTGLEPSLKTDTPLPDMGELNAAVQAARPSVVKIEGEGCNALVEGSGYIAESATVVTNAHVVAGVKKPYVLDQYGRHQATVVLFDPDLDLAILLVKDLAEKPLMPEHQAMPNNTSVAVLGYPAGGGFTAGPGVILESFTAVGRNIYNQGTTKRDVYSIKSDIHQGNSGGPIINKEGKVAGVVFAKSINYDHIAYALTIDQVIANLNKARGHTEAVSTDSCAD
jgi:S1-C subfamily serine protease